MVLTDFETARDDTPPEPTSVPTAVFVHLSGERRGATERITGATVTIGAAADADIVLVRRRDAGSPPIRAYLRRRDLTYELIAQGGEHVWVNGEPVRSLVLASGDVLEFGPEGPVLRFRLYPPGTPGSKSVREAFADCLDCARYSDRSALGKAAIVAAGVPRELATQTSRAFRLAMVGALAVLLTATASLARRSMDLEQRVTQGFERVAGVAALIEGSESRSLGAPELEALRTEVEASLSETTRRLESLEARSSAPGRVVSRAIRSTLFLQGAFAFSEPDSGRLLRIRTTPQGRPLFGPGGEPLLTLDGEGEVFEVLYTGTGFVVDASRGLVITNRHVAEPWVFDENAQGLLARGFEGVMQRFRAYLPDVPTPFPAALASTHAHADVALIRVAGLPTDLPSLPFAARPPSPGDAVIVLGYPLGMRALLARTDPDFVTQLQQAGETSFWTVAERLAEGGHIAPLASRGIVGQVTDQAIVYDAETTSGGSGGPVLTLDGTVIAVNAAILPEFGGSNLGVPAAAGASLLAAIRP